jgi:hypothetical protein
MVIGTGVYFVVTGEVLAADTEVVRMRYGMYFAMLAVIVIIGRREYYNILRTALTFRRTEDPWLKRSANACRVFILAFAVFVWLLTIMGFDWVIALAFACSFSLVILLIARMTAEIGDPWLVNFLTVTSVMPYHFLGRAVLGPSDMTNTAVVQASLDGYGFTTNSVTAQETTINRLREKQSGWFSWAGFNLILAAGICLAIASTIFFTLWDNYSFGGRQERRTYGAETLSYAQGPIQRLKNEGLLAKTDEAHGLAKLDFFRVESRFWRFFAYGAALVGLCALMRLRFSWWPFHPLPLLFFNTWAMSRLYFPFFLGWLIKTALLKIWGGTVFARSKPFFIGVIVGQIVMAGIWIVVNVIYFLIHHTLPSSIMTHALHIFI